MPTSKGRWLLHVDQDVEIELDDRWWVGGGAGWHVAEEVLIGFAASGA